MAGEFEKLFGEVPFGLSRADDCRLIEDALEQNVLAKIKACREAGVSDKKIAEILMELQRNCR